MGDCDGAAGSANNIGVQTPFETCEKRDQFFTGPQTWSERRCRIKKYTSASNAWVVDLGTRLVEGVPNPEQVVAFVQAVREEDLFKPPGVAETLDWATALRELDAKTLTPQVVGDSLGALLKYQDDIGRMQGETLTKTLDTALAKSK